MALIIIVFYTMLGGLCVWTLLIFSGHPHSEKTWHQEGCKVRCWENRNKRGSLTPFAKHRLVQEMVRRAHRHVLSSVCQKVSDTSRNVILPFISNITGCTISTPIILFTFILLTTRAVNWKFFSWKCLKHWGIISFDSATFLLNYRAIPLV